MLHQNNGSVIYNVKFLGWMIPSREIRHDWHGKKWQRCGTARGNGNAEIIDFLLLVAN